MKREMICIVCPNGCDLVVEIQEGQKPAVQGALCKNGAEYAHNELTNPMRTIASSVVLHGGVLPLVSVRLNRPVPKEMIFPIMEEIDKIALQAPVCLGDVILQNVCGSGSDVVVTKSVAVALPIG